MFNPYTIILGLFTAAGLATSLWGFAVIHKARRTARWPYIAGTIEKSNMSSEHDDLLPDICFSYIIADQTYLKNIEFPSGTTPTREFSKAYVEKFPAGMSVNVYYNPDNPEQATLEPGLQAGDWMIFAFGTGATLLMVLLLLLGN